jgi:hypothetical protein
MVGRFYRLPPSSSRRRRRDRQESSQGTFYSEEKGWQIEMGNSHERHENVNPWLGGEGEIRAIKRSMGQEASINMEASVVPFEHKDQRYNYCDNQFFLI